MKILSSANIKKVARILNGVIYLELAGFVIYLAIAIVPSLFARFTYIGPLEHQEGVVLNTLRFFHEGGNIYQPPDLHFAGMIYPPFYFFVARLFIGLFGLSFQSTRLLSLLAIAGTAVSLYFIIIRFTAQRWTALAWLPLFFAAWPLYGWIDVGRLEAFYMFLVCVGACCAIYAERKPWRYLLAGAIFGCAAATKQTGIFFLPALCLAGLFDRRALFMPLGMLFGTGIIYGLGFLLFGSGMYEWVIVAPGHHNHTFDVGFNILALWLRDYCGIALLLAMFLFGLQKRPLRRSSVELYMLYVLVVVGCAAALLPIFKEGSGPMNLALLNAFAIVAGCLTCGWALQGGVIKKSLTVLALGFLGIFAYLSVTGPDIDDRTPAAEDENAYEKLVDLVRSQPGPVWVTTHPWVNVEAGKEPFVPMQELAGEWLGGHPSAGIPPDIVDAISRQQFSMIITGEEYGVPSFRQSFQALLKKYYRYAGELQSTEVGIERIDGVPLRPTIIWVPKK